MSDMATVVVVINDNGKDELVYLFTHWGGSATPHDVKNALKLETLLDEGSHLAGTIFANMTEPARIFPRLPKVKERNGVRARIGWSSHAMIVVNAKTQRVGFAHEDEQPSTYKDWSFSEYISLSPETIDEHYEKGRTVYGEIGRKSFEDYIKKTRKESHRDHQQGRSARLRQRRQLWNSTKVGK